MNVSTEIKNIKKQLANVFSESNHGRDKNSESISKTNSDLDEVKREAESNVSDAWNSEKFYRADAFCLWNNALWLCKFDNMGSEPVEGSLYWEKKNIVSELIRLNNLIKEKEK